MDENYFPHIYFLANARISLIPLNLPFLGSLFNPALIHAIKA
jgi:hypothetical protein